MVATRKLLLGQRSRHMLHQRHFLSPLSATDSYQAAI
jgi:hypothetical protein